MRFNELDPNGNIVREGIELKPYSKLPEGHTWEPYALSMPSKKEVLIRKVKDYRDYLISNGGYQVNGKWFHSDPISRTQQLGLKTLGNGIPQNLNWKTMDKSFVPMTPALANSILQAAAQQDTAIFTYAETLIAAIESSSDPDSIDIFAGWPTTFVK